MTKLLTMSLALVGVLTFATASEAGNLDGLWRGSQTRIRNFDSCMRIATLEITIAGDKITADTIVVLGRYRMEGRVDGNHLHASGTSIGASVLDATYDPRNPDVIEGEIQALECGVQRFHVERVKGD